MACWVAMQPLRIGADFALGAVDGTLLAIWAGEPNADHLGLAVELMLELHRRHPGRLFMLNVITGAAGMPSEAVRARLREYFERMRGKISAAVIVNEHRGILQTLSRAVISTLITITRKPFPLKTFGDREQALIWLSEHDGTPTLKSLERGLRDLEQALIAGRSGS